MQLFIANCTKQKRDFVYRVPETKSPRTQTIRPGGQIKIAGDLNQPQVDSIIDQYRKYGLVAAADVDRSRPFIGLCYSVDKPVKIDVIGRALEHNDEVLTALGQDTRRKMAVAINNSIEKQLQESQLPEALGEVEVTADEVDVRGKQVLGGIKEGVIVTKSAPETPQVSIHRRVPRRGRSR